MTKLPLPPSSSPRTLEWEQPDFTSKGSPPLIEYAWTTRKAPERSRSSSQFGANYLLLAAVAAQRSAP